jgi:hypothetical protein
MKQIIEEFNIEEKPKKLKKGTMTWIYSILSVITLGVLKIFGVIDISWFFIITAIVWIPVSILIIITIIGLFFMAIFGSIGGINGHRRNSKSK